MSGGRRITEQHNVAVRPALAQDPVEIEPGRAAQMAGVAHQAMAVEIGREDALAGSNRLLLRHAIEAHVPPGCFRALDYEGRRLGVELIGMGPNPAMLRLFENERE